MLLRSLVVVGWMGLASLAVNVATAKDAVGPTPMAIDGISFNDSQAADNFGPRFNLSVRDESGRRFLPLSHEWRNESDDSRGVELAFRSSGMPVDVTLAHRASMSVNENGDIEREARSAELRLGRGMNMRRREAPSWDQPAIYFFAASEDEALTWQPGVRNAFGGSSANFALQDRVEIGDLQAGITYEAGGVQASLAYVEREISVRSGSRSFTQDENFAGVTLTMRR